MRQLRRTLCLVVLVGATSSHAQPRTVGERFVQAARELLGVSYEFGGRLLEKGEGIDCQGVLFYAAERIGTCGWKSFSVYPTRSVASAELGKPVAGMSPIASNELDVSKLRVGDVLLLLQRGRNPAEPSIAKLGDEPVWVAHTGVYSGDGKWIVGDHYALRVVETDLREYLERHPNYVGVYVTRMTDAGPAPARCRHHSRMQMPPLLHRANAR